MGRSPGCGRLDQPPGPELVFVSRHHVLTSPCFSFRDTEQFFREDSALGGARVPGPWLVQFAAERRVHLLQQCQQPLPDVPGADGGVHLEWAQRSVSARPGLRPPGSLTRGHARSRSDPGH